MAHMPLLTDCMAGKVLACDQDDGTAPLRLLLYRDMICRVGQPLPPHSDGRLPDSLLFCMVNNLQTLICSEPGWIAQRWQLCLIVDAQNEGWSKKMLSSPLGITPHSRVILP